MPPAPGESPGAEEILPAPRASAATFRVDDFGAGSRAVHAFSTRLGGQFPGSDATATSELFLRSGGFAAGTALLRLRQVHGAEVFVDSDASLPGQPPSADAAVTRRRGVALIIQTADCLPVLLADSRAGVIGAAHVGWRGAVAGVLEATVTAMENLGARAADLEAAVGPGIGPCCFQVGAEVAARFEAAFHRLSRHREGPHVDLPAVAGHRLAGLGLPASAVHHSGQCTSCRTDLFFSHRREEGRTGRLLSGIALRP